MKPDPEHSGLQEIGLPYAADAAISTSIKSMSELRMTNSLLAAWKASYRFKALRAWNAQ